MEAFTIQRPFHYSNILETNMISFGRWLRRGATHSRVRYSVGSRRERANTVHIFDINMPGKFAYFEVIISTDRAKEASLSEERVRLVNFGRTEFPTLGGAGCDAVFLFNVRRASWLHPRGRGTESCGESISQRNQDAEAGCSEEGLVHDRVVNGAPAGSSNPVGRPCLVPTCTEIRSLAVAEIIDILTTWFWESPSALIPSYAEEAEAISLLESRADVASFSDFIDLWKRSRQQVEIEV